jgi:L-alanine-DL-glutamate epimerase-like enolase superfamily enzyme
MKITSARVYTLEIPFKQSFSHHLHTRHHSDSIVVEIVMDTGVRGFGEGVPRPYVTGETRHGCMAHITEHLLPPLMGTDVAGVDTEDAVSAAGHWLAPDVPKDGGAVIAWHAARCAVELALIDAILQAQGRSLGDALPPRVNSVVYSGIISSGSRGTVEQMARRCRDAAFTQVKMKVGGVGDAERVQMVRDLLGPAVSLRLDANAAFRPATAMRFAESVADCDIVSLEQPIPRGDPVELARLRRACPIPIVADESVVTMADARALIAADAVDVFNLRLSKCGGILPTIKMADVAHEAGVGIQLGCQVGETAILSAAGRHVAAHSPDLRFVEGSYGTHLLVEDVAVEDLTFGPGGRAPGLTGTGLGVTVRRDVLESYADNMIEVHGEGG